MGLRGQLNDVGSDSIPLYLVALIASSISHIRSILLTFFLRPVSAQSSSSSTPHHDSDDITRSTDDLSIFNIGSRLTGLILLSEQLCLNRNLSYSHYSSATDIPTRISSDPESDDEDDDDCVVCLSKLIDGDRIRKLPCLHVFHTDCLESWIQLMNFNCPLCRRSVVSVERDDEYERRVADHQSRVATDAESWFATAQV